MSAQREPGDPNVTLLTEQLTIRSDIKLPNSLRPTASRASSNAHHASRTATANTATPQGPPVFTDDPLVPGVTIIKAVHLTELRTAVNQARSNASLAAASWAESLSAGVTLIKAAHIVELRARLNEARTALGLPAANYTDPTLTVGVTTVKAVHIQELRQRVTEALQSNSTETSYDTATNRITTAGITYDAAGQILRDALFRGLKYQYNPEGRMIWSANLDDSNPSPSVYDGTGQRVQTTQAGVTKRYFYDINGSVVAEYEATGGTGYGTLKRLNVKTSGRLLAVDEVQTDGSKVTSYLMADRQGSRRVLMNAAGDVTSRHDYLPYGEELGAGTGAPGSPTGMRTAAQGYGAADNVRQRYADTRLDDATGLDHTLWRKLETKSGRWTTPDPYGKSLRGDDP